MNDIFGDTLLLQYQIFPGISMTAFNFLIFAAFKVKFPMMLDPLIQLNVLWLLVQSV